MADTTPTTPTTNDKGFDPRASRDELEAKGVSLGLASVSTYQNKPTVVKALERVLGGEDAATVDAELRTEADVTDQADTNASTEAGVVAPVQTEDDDTTDDDDLNDDDDTSDDDAAKAKAKTSRKKTTVKYKNQGHPTAFDENGKPLYQV